MAAGSGGIRYNDSTKRIQLMDTEKNWVDWKVYDANAKLEFCALTTAMRPSTLNNFIFPHNGIYLVYTSCYNNSTGFTGITTAANQLDPITVSTTSARYGFIRIFNAEAGQSLSMSVTQADALSRIVVVYIGSGITNISLIEGYTKSDNLAATTTTSSANNIIMIGMVTGTTVAINTISITNDGGHYVTDSSNYACWTNLYSSGSCKISAMSTAGIPFVATLQITK